MNLKSNGQINYRLQYEKMDARLKNAHIIAHEFNLNPYDIDENWGDKQMADTLSFLNELYRKK